MTRYFEDEATPATDDLLDRVAREGAIVPPLWRLEVANVFQSSLRWKRIDTAYRDASIADLGKLPIILDPDGGAHIWVGVLRFSDRFGLTIYDACYLELAQRRALPLAPLDADLRAAGQALGLQILGR
jgi:predicted nucleic acid-binding protein